MAPAPNGYFSVAARKREKQEARARDERLIANGQMSQQQVAQHNGLFSALDPSRARIVQRRARINIRHISRQMA
jgi:hypothetical protein